MRIIMVLILVLIKNSGYSQTNNSYSPKPDYDIDVIGGTPAGVAASVGFARCNKPETTQSAKPFFTYEVRDYLNYWWGSSSLQGPPLYAYPNQAISDKLALQKISYLCIFLAFMKE